MKLKFNDVYQIGGTGQSLFGTAKKFAETDACIFHKELFMNFVRLYARKTGEDKVTAAHIHVTEDFRGDEQYYLDWLVHNRKILGLSISKLVEIEVV